MVVAIAIGTSVIVMIVVIVVIVVIVRIVVRDEDWEGDTVGDFIVNVGEGAQVSQIIAIVIVIVGWCYGQMMVVMVPFMIVVVFMSECC